MMNERKRLNWPETAICLAYDIANYRSEDPYVQVGAVGIKRDKSLCLGYNGAPSGVNIDWSDRDQRRPYVLHAEENVLNLAKPGEIEILAVTHLLGPGNQRPRSDGVTKLVSFRILLS